MPGLNGKSYALNISIETCGYARKLIRLASGGLGLNGDFFWRNSIGQGNFSRARNQAAFAEARFHSIIFAVSLDEETRLARLLHLSCQQVVDE